MDEEDGCPQSKTTSTDVAHGQLELIFHRNLLQSFVEIKDLDSFTMAAVQNSGKYLSMVVRRNQEQVIIVLSAADGHSKTTQDDDDSMEEPYTSDEDDVYAVAPYPPSDVCHDLEQGVTVKLEPSDSISQSEHPEKDTKSVPCVEKTDKVILQKCDLTRMMTRSSRKRQCNPIPSTTPGKKKKKNNLKANRDKRKNSEAKELIIPEVSVIEEVEVDVKIEVTAVPMEVKEEGDQISLPHRKRRRYKIPKGNKSRDIYHASKIPCPASGCIVKKNVPLLRQHITEIHGKDCNISELWFEYDDRVHRLMEYAGEAVTCPFCDRQRNGIRGIKIHIRNCHPDSHLGNEDFEAIRREVKAKQRMRERASFVREKCSYCDEFFHSRESLWAHTRFKCQQNPHTVKRVNCGKCGAKFFSPQELEKHMKHHNHTRYVCELCGNSYAGRGGLSSHMRGFHQVENVVPIIWYTCAKCGKKFYSKSRYTRHIAMHSEDRNVQCEHCGKCFKTKNCVRKHVNSMHKNKYRYRCEKCGHGMDRKIYLKNHKCGRVRRPQNVNASMATGTDEPVASNGELDNILNQDRETTTAVCQNEINCGVAMANVIMTTSESPNGVESTKVNLLAQSVPQNDRMLPGVPMTTMTEYSVTSPLFIMKYPGLEQDQVTIGGHAEMAIEPSNPITCNNEMKTTVAMTASVNHVERPQNSYFPSY